jgi:hypothetical protein
VGTRWLASGEHERRLETLLDGLLGVETGNLVDSGRVRGEGAKCLEVRGRALDECGARRNASGGSLMEHHTLAQTSSHGEAARGGRVRCADDDDVDWYPESPQRAPEPDCLAVRVRHVILDHQQVQIRSLPGIAARVRPEEHDAGRRTRSRRKQARGCHSDVRDIGSS